jgi:hypothetical protein
LPGSGSPLIAGLSSSARLSTGGATARLFFGEVGREEIIVGVVGFIFSFLANGLYAARGDKGVYGLAGDAL